MSHQNVRFKDATEDSKWSDAELVLDFNPPDQKSWFSHEKPEDLIHIQW